MKMNKLNANNPKFQLWASTIDWEFDTAGSLQRQIASLGSYTGPALSPIPVYPCNQFSLFCYIQGAGGTTISRIAINGFTRNSWKPNAPTTGAFTFDILNGGFPLATPFVLTFGVYSNTTLDLAASGALHYEEMTISVYNTDAVAHNYTIALVGDCIHGRQYSEEALFNGT